MDPVERLALATREARFGEHGGVNPSIEVSTTFTVLDAKTLPDIFNGFRGPDPKQGGCYLYGRSYSPTVQQLARQLAAMENTESAYAVSSGMAAISSAILALCNSGDHIVCSNCVYGGTFAFMKTYLPLKCGIHVTFVDITDLAAAAAAITPQTKVVYCEVVSNPTLVVADLPELARLAHAAGASLVVDNTFTPLAVTPTAWGADVVVHSLTKFVSGASDIIAGAVCGRSAFVQALMDLHTGPIMLQGPTMDPRIASELLIRLPHLPLRMAEHSKRAAAMADMLQGLGAKVSYPGLANHKGHAVLKRLLNPGYGFGGLLGIDMGTSAQAEALMERLQNKHGFGLMAVSLGYADTLMSLSAASTSSELSAADKAKADISDGYVRMSIGITGTLEQRLWQLQEAYKFASTTNGVPPYKATKVRLQPNGQLHELFSWPSWGPQEDEAAEDEHAAAEATVTAAAMAAASAVHTQATGDTPAALLLAAATPAVRAAAAAAAAAAAGGAVAAVKAAAMAGTAAAADTSGGSSAGASSSLTDVEGGAGSLSDDAEVRQGDVSSNPKGAGEDVATRASRLSAMSRPSSESPSRPVKIRKLDEDTHVVYLPLGRA